MQLTNKTLLILISILLIAIIGSGIYYLRVRKAAVQNLSGTITPSVTYAPDPTENWPTYTSTAQKFSIKYPPEWKVGIGDGKQLVYFYSSPLTIKEQQGLPFLPPHISIGIKDIPFRNSPTTDVTINGEPIIGQWQVVQIKKGTAHMYTNLQCNGQCPTRTVDVPYQNGEKILSFYLTTLSPAQLASASSKINAPITNTDEQTLLRMLSTLTLTQ